MKPRVCCRYRILDECDEMLNMGFVDDVELILKAGGAADTMQTLLFSATLPSWVKDITKRFLRGTHKTVDLVGTDKMKVRAIRCFVTYPLMTQGRTAVLILRASAADAGCRLIGCAGLCDPACCQSLAGCLAFPALGHSI